MRNLEKRICALENLAAPEACYVARCVNGKLEPSIPGKRLAPYVAVLPEVAKSIEEWLELVERGNWANATFCPA